MQIVIEIPNRLYANLSKIQRGSIASKRILDCVRNGKVLPKGHGRLIDADALWKKWVFDAIGKQEIDEAPTIIEADKVERE